MEYSNECVSTLKAQIKETKDEIASLRVKLKKLEEALKAQKDGASPVNNLYTVAGCQNLISKMIKADKKISEYPAYADVEEGKILFAIPGWSSRRVDVISHIRKAMIKAGIVIPDECFDLCGWSNKQDRLLQIN